MYARSQSREVMGMAIKLVTSVALAALAVIGTASVSAAADVSLALPQATAFAILGHSCGGIQEQAFASGFDANGDPAGAVYMQTRCGGSGRGGGYHTTTYSRWAGVSWDFAGNVLAESVLASVPTLDPGLSQTDAYGDTVYNTGNHAYVSVALPLAPTGVAALYAGGRYRVTWDASSATPSTLSFTVKATPVAPSTADMVEASAAADATSALIGPLQPLTSYLIVVSSASVAGTSEDSSPPVSVTTPASVQPPAAPTGLTARWIGTSVLVATWKAAVPGDSPIDAYAVRVSAYDADAPVPSPQAKRLPGSVLSASFTLDSSSNWKIIVRAHNAAGWGPWSKAVVLGGL
jgi:hypothetical protein